MCFKASAALSETKTRPTSSSSSSSSEEEEEATSINGTVYCQVQAGSRLSPLINSVSNIHAVFERWTLKFAHVFYMSLWNHSRLNFPFHFLSLFYHVNYLNSFICAVDNRDVWSSVVYYFVCMYFKAPQDLHVVFVMTFLCFGVC